MNRRSAELPLDVEQQPSAIWRDVAIGAGYSLVGFVLYGGVVLVMAVLP